MRGFEEDSREMDGSEERGASLYTSRVSDPQLLSAGP